MIMNKNMNSNPTGLNSTVHVASCCQACKKEEQELLVHKLRDKQTTRTKKPTMFQQTVKCKIVLFGKKTPECKKLPCLCRESSAFLIVDLTFYGQ